MKRNSLWVILTLITFFGFQKSSPVQSPRPLAQAFGVLIDSLEKYKHPTFEQALERANFLRDLAAYHKDWDMYFKILNIKVNLAEYHDKIDLIVPFIKDNENKLSEIDPNIFSKYLFYKSEIKLRWVEYYSMLRQPEGAINISKEIIEGIQNGTLVFENNSISLQRTYYTLGYWTSEIGQITEGIDYFLLSKQLNEADNTRELDLAIIIYGQLAKRYLSLGQYEQAFNFNKIAEQTAQSLYKQESVTNQNAPFFVSNYHAIGKYYLQIVKPDSALFYLQKANQIAATNQKVENAVLRAKCFNLLKKWELAEDILIHTLAEIGDKPEIFGTQKPQIYLQLAQLNYQQQQPIVALNYCQKALKVLDPQCDTSHIQNMPSLSRVLMKKELLETLQFKSQILKNLAQQSADYIIPCYETAFLAVHLIDTIRGDYTSDYDKQYLAQTSYPIYETALDISFQLYQKEKKDTYLVNILMVMEKSKAVVLLNNFQKGQAEIDFSDNDRLKVYQLRKELTQLDKQIFDRTLKNATLTDTTLQKLESQRALLNRNYDTYMVGLKKQYPNYAAIKFGAQSVNIADIRKALLEDGVFIEYFVGENSIYSLAVDDKNAQVFRNSDPQRLLQCVENIRQSIRPHSRDDAHTDIEKYCVNASELYDWLFKAPLSISGRKPSSIVVSLDGALNFIPIDILLTQTVTTDFNYRTLPYLLQQANVSYVPSATVWQSQKSMPHHRVAELFVGFAPQYKYTKPVANTDIEKYKNALAMAEKSGELVDMPNARREVEEIAKLFKTAKIFVGATATEDNFVKYAANYRIVHLSMHAEVNPKNPAFSQFIFTQNDTFSSHNRLFMNELQDQKLNADLVVLSACETGFGALSRGEGVMSLARTFTSIGVPTSVVSLWKIPSGATENVLTQFYIYLAQNQSIVTALRQSKLDYLQNQSLNSPYYWAGLIAVGDTNYAPIENKAWQWLGLMGLLFVGFCSWLFMQRKLK
jgi:CHAT domain-containing protein